MSPGKITTEVRGEEQGQRDGQHERERRRGAAAPAPAPAGAGSIGGAGAAPGRSARRPSPGGQEGEEQRAHHGRDG